MVERGDRSPVATFYVESASRSRAEVDAGPGAAHHARVRRLAVNDPVQVRVDVAVDKPIGYFSVVRTVQALLRAK